jgi:hypothetical protein
MIEVTMKCIFQRSYVNVNVLQWINMVKVIEYHFVSSHELSECVIENNVKVWITNKKYSNFLQFCLYFALSNSNQEDCITIDAKCLVFLWFSLETLVCASRVFKTLYQPFTKLHSCKTPCKNSSSYPHYFFLGFW